MRILKIWDAEYPWDVRVEKVLGSLVAAGHEVHLAARNRDRRPLVEPVDGATVHRLPPWRWLGRSLDAASQFPAFVNPRWLRLLRSVARRVDAELVLVRDLPLAPVAVEVARRRGIPVVLDMAENYPAMLRAIWDHGRQKRFDRLVRNPELAQRVERWVLDRVDHVLVVVEESKERLVGLGVDEDRVTVVSNTPLRRRIGAPSARGSADATSLRAAYLGLMEAPRGVQVLVEAVRILRDRGVEASADLVGAGRDLDDFVEQARGAGLLGGPVRFHGYIPYDEALAVVARADVGVIPHVPDELWHTTIPNKLFDYMALGLPVVTSDARPAARIVRETGCGIVAAGGSPGAMADAIAHLRDPEARRAAGRAGHAAVLARYNWEHDERRLLAALERVAGQRGRKR